MCLNTEVTNPLPQFIWIQNLLFASFTETYQYLSYLLIFLLLFYSASVKTDLLTGGAMSRLYIANANRYDSGNYTCALADIAQATVAVHVLNGNYDVVSRTWTVQAWIIEDLLHSICDDTFCSVFYLLLQVKIRLPCNMADQPNGVHWLARCWCFCSWLWFPTVSGDCRWVSFSTSKVCFIIYHYGKAFVQLPKTIVQKKRILHNYLLNQLKLHLQNT